MKRICIFCEKWESGGIESFLTNVLTHMDLSEIQIDIVVSELAKSVFVDPLKKLGITFFELSGTQRRFLKNRELFQKHLQKKRYDIIYLNIFQGLSLQYLKIAQKYHIEYRIVHSHNTNLRKSWTRKLKLLIHRAAKLWYGKYATEYLACSKEAAEFMFPAQCRYRFIPNGIDVKRFSFCGEHREMMRKRLGAADTCLVIGSVGRLCTQKNQLFVLEIMASLLYQNSNAILLLIGDGEDRQKLERRAETLGIKEHVVFYGTTQEVEPLYAAMDLLVFPSLFEGLGIVAIEAQVNGLPVLCSEYVPPEACITNLAVTLPLTLGPVGWAEAVCRYAGHKTLSRDEIQCCQQFDINMVAEEMRHLFGA